MLIIIECLGDFGSMYAFEWLDNATTNETTKEISASPPVWSGFTPIFNTVTPTHLHD